MKTRYTLLLLPAVFIPLALIAQGPLTPPGAPAPQMKTLQQVEPRVDVATLPGDGTAVFLISAPGSYYLSGNVAAASGKAAVAIAAVEVTLDLNGFAVTGVAGAPRGVELRNGANGVSVRNGVISNVSAGPGVGGATVGATLTNVQLEGLTIRNCAGGVILPAQFTGITAERLRVTGGTSTGLDLGNQSVVSRCVVEGNSGASATPLYGIRAGVVTACEVSQLTNTSGTAIGISALQVKDSSVATIAGSGTNTSGILAPAVANCKVSKVTSTTSGVLHGISSTGQVNDCDVDGIGDLGQGSPTGILGSTVSGCHVTKVGNAFSTGATYGINTDGGVSHCTVTQMGDPAFAFQITGISTPLASHCRVFNIAGSGNITGILGGITTNCSVDSLTQGATATQAVTGIDGDQIIDCRVVFIAANSATGSAKGCANYRLASRCTALNISNNGGPASIGFLPASQSQTLHCVVNGAGSAGVSGAVECVVKGCSVRLSGSGTGIELAGASCVIEDNAVSSCTTGISAPGSNGLVVRNRVTLCTTNITASASSQVGPMVTAAGTIASTSPWANFTD